MYFVCVKIPLTNKLHNFPEYLLKLSAATDLMQEYVELLENSLLVSYDVAYDLVWNYRADELLNHKDNMVILKKNYVEDDIKKFELKVAYIENSDQALSFITSDMGPKKDGSIHIGSDTGNFEPIYMFVGGVRQHVWCTIEDNKMQFFLKAHE